MFRDAYLDFCDKLSLAGATGTALLGNVIDLGNTSDGIITGELFLVITVLTDIVTAGTAGTLQFILASDAQEAIAVDGTATEHIITHAFVTDDVPAIPAGTILYVGKLPAGVFKHTGDSTTYERYLGLVGVVGTTDVDAGSINAFLTNDPKAWKPTASGI